MFRKQDNQKHFQNRISRRAPKGVNSSRSTDKEFNVDKLRRFKEYMTYAKLKECVVWKTRSLESLPKLDDILI